MDSKDARESLESGGCGARCRCSNGRRNSAAVFFIHSLLLVVCAAFSLSVYISQRPGNSKHDIGIFMQMTSSTDLRFLVTWNQTVDLIDNKRLKLSCAGPYTVYLWACTRKINTGAVVNVTLEQGTNSFHLETLKGTECKAVQRFIMLSEKEEVTVKVAHVKDDIRIDRLYIGLHYMLGAQCFYYPLDHELLKQHGS